MDYNNVPIGYHFVSPLVEHEQPLQYKFYLDEFNTVGRV